MTLFTHSSSEAYQALGFRQNDSVVTPLLICMLGPFRLLSQGAQLLQGRRKAELLLSTLALQPRQALTRSYLLDALWPEADQETSGPLLRHLLFTLRQSFSAALCGEPPIVREGDLYRLNLCAGVNIDVSEFEARIAQGDLAVRQGNGTCAVQHYKEALTLYRGDLLQHDTTICNGEYACDVEIERERLRNIRVRALNHLAHDAFARGIYLDCMDYAQAILSSKPCYEPAYRIIMRCHVRRGERALAFTQFDICRNTLQKQFGVMPEQETLALFESIRLKPETI